MTDRRLETAETMTADVTYKLWVIDADGRKTYRGMCRGVTRLAYQIAEAVDARQHGARLDIEIVNDPEGRQAPFAGKL